MDAAKKREIKEHEKLYEVYNNKLQFRSVEQGQVDGVKLTDDEREYLLPHFLMLLVGKPGSGKTTLLKQLLTNPQMYHRKFDDVFIVSPSHAKMGIKVRSENTTAKFSLDWLFDKFAKINEDQYEECFGHRVNRNNKDKKSLTEKKTLASGTLLNDSRSRFLLSDAFAGAMNSRNPTSVNPNDPRDRGREKEELDQQRLIQKKYEDLKKLPRNEQERTHRNVLVVLDDVVGSVKKAEYDPRLAQLVMNRRHIIFNGTISIIMVTQKYTLIPARVRSNASWLILYQLNPNDFETAYRDAVTLPIHEWRNILYFVYGVNLHTKPQKKDKKGQDGSEIDEPEEQEESKGPSAELQSSIGDELKNKKYENLGIWVESNMYFKNFKRLRS